MTKAEARTYVWNMIDDPNGERWTQANLDILFGLVLDVLWADIFKSEPRLLMARENIDAAGLTSPGFVQLSSLAQRYFAILEVTRDSKPYTKGDEKRVVLQDDAAISWEPRTWVVWDSELWLFPLSATSDVEVAYTYLPPKWATLADGDTVIWPDGYDLVYLNEVAGRAFFKGDAEDGAKLLTLAAQDFKRLLTAIRQDFEAVQIKGTDAPQDWGGL